MIDLNNKIMIILIIIPPWKTPLAIALVWEDDMITVCLVNGYQGHILEGLPYLVCVRILQG